MPPKPAAARAPVPAAGHCWPVPLQETLKHSKAGLVQSPVESVILSFGPHVHKVLFVPFEYLWRVWDLIVNAISYHLLPSRRSFSFVLGCRASFFGGIQHSLVDGCSAASCNFGILTGENECMSLYSAILRTNLSRRLQLKNCKLQIWLEKSLGTPRNNRNDTRHKRKF